MAIDPWRPYAVTACLFISFYSLNFVSRFRIGCPLTFLHSNRCFRVKTLNPVSSLATDDLTFATPAVVCVNPISASYRPLLMCQIHLNRVQRLWFCFLSLIISGPVLVLMHKPFRNICQSCSYVHLIIHAISSANRWWQWRIYFP
jgi:hypothetical protein